MRFLKFGAAAFTFVVLMLLLAWLIAARQVEPPPTSPHAQTGERLDESRASSITIAPPDEALTLARMHTAQGLRMLRVLRYEGGRVTGVDITAHQRAGAPDPITLWNETGYEGIARAGGETVTVEASRLAVPFDGTDVQIAMGATYPDHAREATIEQPFVFPKRRAPDVWNLGVPARHHLLDYEIELGFVALSPIAQGEAPRHMGLVLATDYTDRALMLREMDLFDTHSGQGFTGAKSVVPAMPIGALLVIPRDLRSFYRTLDLRLYVNSQLRQVARPRELTWTVDRMLEEAFARRHTAFRHAQGQAQLPVRDDRIPARTLVLSGTTDGVAFRPPSGRQIFLGVMHWLTSLKWTRLQLLIEPTIAEAYANGHHLQPGDTVAMRADRLGIIVNRIVP